MEPYEEFVARVKELSKSGDEIAVMYELQKELNEFIESLCGIDKSNNEKWIKNYTLAMIQEVSELI